MTNKQKNKIMKIFVLFMIVVSIGSMVTSPISATESLDNYAEYYKLANTEQTRFSVNNLTDFIIKGFGGGGGGGLNTMQMNNVSSDLQTGKSIKTSSATGEIFIGATGGVGWIDDIVLMISVNGTISDDFKISLAGFGYDWAPVAQPAKPTYDMISAYNGTNITLNQSSFAYNSTWKPTASNYPYALYSGGDPTNLTNMFYSSFVDMNVGVVGTGTMNQFTQEQKDSIDNYGMGKIIYIVENLAKGSSITINAYGWTNDTNNAKEQIAWTNNNVLTYIIYGNTIFINNTMTSEEIQSLMDTADIGDVIKFATGNYNNLALTISTSVNIIANGIVNFIGDGTGTAFNIQASDVNITGFNIEKYNVGINFNTSDELANNLSINNTTIKDSNYGINGSTNGTVLNNNTINNITNASVTINGNNNNITNNIINGTSSSDGNLGYGIRVDGDNTTISNNNISNISTNGIWSHGNNAIIEKNIVKNADNGIVVSKGDNKTIKNNTVENIKNSGIRSTHQSTNVTVEKNNIKNSSIGIDINGKTSIIKNNQVNESRDTGIQIGTVGSINGNDTKIENNNLYKNTNYGINVNGGNTLVNGNTISNEKFGINIGGSPSNVTISNNNFIATNNPLTGIAASVSSNNIIVDNSMNSSTIQSIINGLSSTDEIIFQTGTYTNIFLTIANSINMVANGTVVFKGPGASSTNANPAINITSGATGITIAGFTIDGYKYGIMNEANAIINKNTIKNSYYGIYNTAKATISNNTIANNSYGIYDLSTTGTIINNKNNIQSNTYGIYLKGTKTTVESNTITKNTNTGIYNLGNSNTLTKNTITSNKYGIYNKGKAIIATNTVIGNSYGIYDLSTTGTTINNKNNIQSNTYGIYLKGTKTTVESNTITKNTNYGIYIEGKENTVGKAGTGKGNTISQNKFGIGTSTGSSKNTINYNTITKNTNYGIYNLGSYNKATKNTITSNKYGIYNKGTKATISTNTITKNTNYGIYDISSYANILKNTVSSNKYGIYNKGKRATISQNTIKSNTATGIYVFGKYVKILKNTIASNKLGLNYVKKTNTNSGNKISKNKVNIAAK
ncbi:MAG: right-handed parallel beta-helix repeat-containing protein [Methanobacteriaceae archaeon]